MNDLWISAGRWLLHTAVGGGLLLLVTAVLMRWTRQPARRQRLGDWGMTAALLVAVLSLVGPSWLVVSWPLPGGHDEPQTIVREPEPVGVRLLEAEPADVLEEPPLAPVAAAAPAAAETEAHIDLWQTAAHGAVLAFAAIAGLLALRLLLGYVGLMRLVLRCEPAPADVRGLFAAMAAGTRWARLLVSRRLLVPLSCGLVRPTVVLPAGLCARPTSRQLRWVFAHELTHLRRRDAWSGLLFNLGQIVFFYLPWFWWLRRQVRLCQEFVADAAAAGQDEQAISYAEFLVSLANAPAVPLGATGVSGNCSDLFRRVTMLLKDPLRVETGCPRRWTFAVAGGLLSLAVLVAGFGYRAEAADDIIVIVIRKDGDKAPEKKKEPLPADKKKIIIELKGDEKGKLVLPPGIDLKGEPRMFIEKFIQLQDMGEGQEQAIRKALEWLGKYQLDKPPQIKPPPVDPVPFKGGFKGKKVETVTELHRLLAELEALRAAQAQGIATEKQIKERIDHLQKLIADLKDAPVTARPRFGVSVEPLPPVVADHLDLPKNVGMLVVDVAPDSAAARVGIKVKDILYKIDGAVVPGNSDDFVKLIGSFKTNTPLDVVVIRKGQQQKLGSVQLGDGPTAKDPGKVSDKLAKELELRLTEKRKKIDADTKPPTEKAPTPKLVVKHQDGNSTVTLHGTLRDGRFTLGNIEVQDKAGTRTYERIEDVPEPYRARALEMVDVLRRNNEPPQTK
jgi:beta-lactamase regulating signal transducer with metallopeptidase domain